MVIFIVNNAMRLITFGCSFTDYSWPTWADIIARDLDCEYENWAIGGGGNQQPGQVVVGFGGKPAPPMAPQPEL